MTGSSWPTSGGRPDRGVPVQREQLAVTVERITAEVDELQPAEPHRGRQGLKLVLLQVQAPEPLS